MRELLQQDTSKKSQEQEEAPVLLFIAGQVYSLGGGWEWPLRSERLFCSDVMLTVPSSFEGTKAIFHPDDLPAVREALEAANNGFILSLSFRIISSYGEVHEITGRRVVVTPTSELDTLLLPTQNGLAALLQKRQLKKDAWSKRATELAERIADTGSWWLNTVTHELYYSDGIFRIYGLLPQSLNAHLNTFSAYTHPDDHEVVGDAIAKSFQWRQPLHLNFRITSADGKEKKVLQTMHWECNEEGTLMLFGTLQDLTGYYSTEEKAETAADVASFQSRLLKFNEVSTRSGHWYMNLVTRKVGYSDAFFRLHGLKPGSVQGGINFFLNFVHAEDRDVVKEVTQKIRSQHMPPEIDYRIVRSDGKMRYLRQRGKLIDHGGEMVMVCTVEDISAQRFTEKKLSELGEKIATRQYLQQEMEEAARMGSWEWDLKTGDIQWSDGFYKLLGYKPKTSELTLKHFIRSIQTDDRKQFEDELNLMLTEKRETVFPFRVIRSGDVRHMIATFRLFAYEQKELFVCTVQDISRQEGLQTELTQRIHFADILTKDIPDRVLITDENNNIILWNNRCEEAFGYKPEYALNKNFFELLPELKEGHILEHFNQALKGETLRLNAIRVPGQAGYHDVLMVPMKNDVGDVTGILHFLRNVTDQKQTETRLGERLNFIESLVEASVDRIIVLDRHMNYLYCNGKAADYYNVTKEEIIGKNVLEIFPDSMNKPTFEHFRRALKGETVSLPAIEGFMDEHFYQVYLAPIKNDRGDVTAVLWMHHDLSKEILLQRQLKKSDEILSNIREAYLELDEEAVLRYVNPRTEELLAVSQANLIGKKLVNVFPQLAGTDFYEAISSVIREQKEVRGEYFFPVMQRWVFASASPFNGGTILLFYDIDEMRTARMRLEQNEALLNAAEAVSNSGSYEVDIPTMSFRFSDGLYRIFGNEPQSFVPDMDLIESWSHPDDNEPIRAILGKAVTNKSPYSYTRRIYQADGTLRLIEVHGLVTTDAAGNAEKFVGVVQDITERKNAEERILETKNLLEQTTAATPDAITIYDLVNKEPVYLNNCLGEWVGYSSEELVSLGYAGRLQLLAEADRSRLQAFNRQMLMVPDNRIQMIEYMITAKDGHAVWIRNRSRVFKRDDSGAVTHILSVLQDITEQKTAAQQLAQQTYFIEQVTDATPDFIMVSDLVKRKIIYVNKQPYRSDVGRYEETLQLEYDGILARAHPDDREKLHQFLEEFRSAADEELRSLEFRIVKGKDAVWYKATVKVFQRDEAGAVTQLIEVLHDITAEVKLRQQLEERSRYAETLIDNSIDRMLVLDKEHRIIGWNRRCEEIYGIKKEAILGTGFFGQFPKLAEDAIVTGSFQRALAGEKVYLPMRKEVYSNRFSELFYIPIKNDAEEVDMVLHIIHDITKFHEAKMELRETNTILEAKNKELEQRNEEASMFAFIASHDLKEPLRKVNVFSHWLQEKERENLSPKGQDMLQRLSASVSRMNLLIQDLLGLSQIQITHSKEPTDLNAVLQEVCTELDEDIQSAGATLHAPELPTINAIPIQTGSLIKNILANSLAYSRPGEKPVIHIEASFEEVVSGDETRDFLKLSFRDNGMGFDQKYEKKIFQIFQRLHAASGIPGTGMGLTICKKVMENHGGHITAEGKPGEGACFSCYFPV